MIFCCGGIFFSEIVESWFYNTEIIINLMNFSNLCQQFDRQKAKQLIFGVLGVNMAFLIAGVQYEKITTMKYLNTTTGEQEFFRTTAGFIMIQRFINWMLGLIYQHFTLPKSERVNIPTKNSLSTGFIIYLSSIAQTESMYLVSYPLIIMAKSCSLLNVILVGIFCSRVRNKELKLGPKKIIVALGVTIGIITFRLFDPKANFDDNKKTELLGLFLLLISLFADGFIPDFQAQIKEKYKPAPIQMLITLNKWCAICSFVHLVLTNQFFSMFTFCLQHPMFNWDLLLLSLSAFVGQIFVYRMIKEFKQHIVPFVVTTRKIITVGLSLIYFHHQTSFGQVSSIVIVFIATVYEFLDSVRKPAQIKTQLGGSQTTELNGSSDTRKQVVIFKNGFEQALTEEELPSIGEQSNP